MSFFQLSKPFCVAVLCLLVQACAKPIDIETLKSKYLLDSSSFVDVDGNVVHVSQQGRGEAIVLIHGTASSLHAWDEWADILSQNFRVIRMDLPGFGLTGPEKNNRYEVSDDVKFLDQLLNKLQIESAHLVGSSLGGRIAWEYSLTHAQRVKSLTLLNSLGYPQESWPPAIQAAQWPIFDSLMTVVSPRFMYEIGLSEVYFDQDIVDDKLVDRYFELSRFPGNLEAFPKRVKARLDDEAHKIIGIQTPTLIMWGEEDAYFPVESAHKFHSDIPNSVLKVFPRVGHLPMEEIPEDSAQVFLEFIATLES